MSTLSKNTTDLQDLLNKVNNLPQAGSGGENVTEETEAYTSKLETLETAIRALETELAGKAAGGAGVETWTGTINCFGLGDIPHRIVYYTDETLTPRIMTVAPATSETITIVANTKILIYSSPGGDIPPEEPHNDRVIKWPYTIFLTYLPTADNFEIN